MAKYYKVPKKTIYENTFDEEGNITGNTENIIGYEPDIPKGVSFVGSVVGLNYFIKVSDDAVIPNGQALGNIPDQLLKSKVKGVK